jgi:hypothetical protein
MSLPGYDDWKTHNPDDDRCEHCGAPPEYGSAHAGWRPERCTGECGTAWRDPDFEYDQVRDESDE